MTQEQIITKVAEAILEHLKSDKELYIDGNINCLTVDGYGVSPVEIAKIAISKYNKIMSEQIYTKLVNNLNVEVNS